MRDAVSLKTNRVVFTWNKMRRRNQSYRGTTLRKHTSVYNETSITNVTFILLNMTTTSSVWSRYTAEQIGGSDVVIGCDLFWPNRLWPSLSDRLWPNRLWTTNFDRLWPTLIDRLWPKFGWPTLAKPTRAKIGVLVFWPNHKEQEMKKKKSRWIKSKEEQTTRQR